MKCFQHPDADAVGYCRQCGRGLCAACRRDVRGMAYCEECLASTVLSTSPASGGPNPGLALLLGFLPGVGALYNGDYIKALIHFFAFLALVHLNATGHMQPMLGLLLAGFIVYMAVDAYQTAKRRAAGQAPAPMSWEAVGFGGGSGSKATPLGPIIVIVLGVIFLLNSLDMFFWARYVWRFWPLILIALGAWLLWKQSAGGRG